MVTSLVLSQLTFFLLILRLQFLVIKYIIPAATDCGVFSGISLSRSIFNATNLHSFVNSALIFKRLQNLSIKANGLFDENVFFRRQLFHSQQNSIYEQHSYNLLLN